MVLICLQNWTASFADMFDIASGDNPREGTTRIGVVEFWGEGYFFPNTRRSEVPVALGEYSDERWGEKAWVRGYCGLRFYSQSYSDNGHSCGL